MPCIRTPSPREISSKRRAVRSPGVGSGSNPRRSIVRFPLQNSHSIATADKNLPGESEEESVFDRADDMIEMVRDFLGVFHRAKRAVDDEISAIGYVGLGVPAHSQRWIPAELPEPSLRRLPAKLHDLDRHRHDRAETPYELRFVCNDGHAPARRRNDFFPQQRSAAAFDEVERAGLDFVSAVDDNIDLGLLGKGGERNSESSRLLRRLL